MLNRDELETLERINNKWWALSAFDRGLKVWDRLPDILLRFIGALLIVGGLTALGWFLFFVPK